MEVKEGVKVEVEMGVKMDNTFLSSTLTSIFTSALTPNSK